MRRLFVLQAWEAEEAAAKEASVQPALVQLAEGKQTETRKVAKKADG